MNHTPSDASLREDAYGDHLPGRDQLDPKPLTESQAKKLLETAIEADEDVRGALIALGKLQAAAKAARTACLNQIPSGRYLVTTYTIDGTVHHVVLLEEGDSFKSEKLDDLGKELAAGDET